MFASIRESCRSIFDFSKKKVSFVVEVLLPGLPDPVNRSHVKVKSVGLVVGTTTFKPPCVMK